LKWPLNVQRWEKGDIFAPFGLNHRKKVSDFLTDRKIQPSLKENTLKLTDADGTIHALLYPEVAPNGEHGAISDHVCITEEESRILTITKKHLL
jgi:tRNA(Ile)-lysidine synthetase-like protein